MKVLLCHNQYQQPGGEDLSFAAEADLLERHGHAVIRHVVHNDELNDMSRLRAAARTLWSSQSYRSVRDLVRSERPDIMHCTNTFPLLSPSIYYAAKQGGIPVVQSLRNYRLLCPSFTLLRGGAVCEDCLLKSFAWPGVMRGCYRGSRAASAVVATLAGAHRLIGTWSNMVDVYFTPTQFARQKFISAGFDAERIQVKPNFIDPDPGVGSGEGDYAMFVGRLSAEKGLRTLIEAWHRLDGGLPLKIVGEGPLADEVARAAAANPAIEWLGGQSHAEVLGLVGSARCLIMPSVWYETFGRTIIEAFAKGTPVIASRLGCMEELVEEGVNGLHFSPGDADDLARAVQCFQSDRALHSEMRLAARAAFESRYTGAVNYALLLGLYERALGRERAPAEAAPAATEETVRFGTALEETVLHQAGSREEEIGEDVPGFVHEELLLSETRP